MWTIGRTRSSVALPRGTARDIALVCGADAIVGASFGAVSVAGGLPLWVPAAMSVLVFAGGAQFAAVGVVLGGGSPVAGAVAGLIMNARLLPYGFAVAGVFGGRWPARLAGAHLLTDESAAFALRPASPAQRRAAFWACGAGLFVSWNLAVLAGALAGRIVTNPGVLGLDAAFPAVLVALVLPALTGRRARRAAVAGAAVAVAATPFLPPGLPLLLSLGGLALAWRQPAGAPVAGPAEVG
jgi:branched chain amino acid efflux pump